MHSSYQTVRKRTTTSCTFSFARRLQRWVRPPWLNPELAGSVWWDTHTCTSHIQTGTFCIEALFLKQLDIHGHPINFTIHILNQLLKSKVLHTYIMSPKLIVICGHVYEPYCNNDSYSYSHKSILFRLNVCNVWVVVGCWSLGIAMPHYWSWQPSIADGSKQCSEAMFTTIPHPTHAAHTYTTPCERFLNKNPWSCF